MTEWKHVVGYEGVYEVSSNGQVRRIGRSSGARTGRLLRLANHPCGYLAVNLWKNGSGMLFLVHRLVAAAFLGVIPDRYEVNHRDGNKKNNDLSNLEIVSRQENIDHAVATGLIDNKGSKNPASRLTADQVEAIRSAYVWGGYRNGGSGYKALAAQYGVAWGTIRSIVKYRVWQHV